MSSGCAFVLVRREVAKLVPGPEDLDQPGVVAEPSGRANGMNDHTNRSNAGAAIVFDQVADLKLWLAHGALDTLLICQS